MNGGNKVLTKVRTSFTLSDIIVHMQNFLYRYCVPKIIKPSKLHKFLRVPLRIHRSQSLFRYRPLPRRDEKWRCFSCAR